MTRIDFYVLASSDPKMRAVTACRLAEKAYSQGLKVYVHTDSAGASLQLDELLWTFRAGSFLPHAIVDTPGVKKGADLNCGSDPFFTPDLSPPILLGHDHEPAEHTDVLINLAHDVPLFFGRFERVAELVDQQETHLSQARDRYRFYRERGYELNSHQLKS